LELKATPAAKKERKRNPLTPEQKKAKSQNAKKNPLTPEQKKEAKNQKAKQKRQLKRQMEGTTPTIEPTAKPTAKLTAEPTLTEKNRKHVKVETQVCAVPANRDALDCSDATNQPTYSGDTVLQELQDKTF
jgi:hypothetical protein